MPGSRLAPRTNTLRLLLTLAVLGCGALEAWFGRPELFGDDISYLDVTHMLQAHQWQAALNPLWSIGYPLLLSALRPLFPAGIHGELTAVFCLNMAIYLAGWLSFLYFLRTAAEFVAPAQSVPHSSQSYRDEWDPAILLAAACIYICAQVNFGRISSIGPDQLVTCIFFLASATLLRFARQNSTRNGILLGTILGLGFVAKAVFLPLSVIVITAALLPFRRQLSARTAVSIPAGLLIFMLPYATALSWAVGRPTLGESGALNYAFHVNQLPHWMGWQGGPPRLGLPDHPVHLLRQHPAVFTFAEPFHVTYPPHYNIFYWYDGYRHFFSPLNALHAIATNLHELEKVLHENWPITLALLLAFLTLIYTVSVPHPSRRFRWVGSNLRKVWLLWLPSLLGIALYIQVHLEGRYIAAFFAILAMLPFLTLGQVSTRIRTTVIAILIAGTLLNLSIQLRPPLRRALAHDDMESTEQWQIAHYLAQSGLIPGDKVGAVTTGNDIRCTWAYTAGLHIVAAIGNDAYNPADQQQDFDHFWNDAATQQDVLDLFRKQGAVAIIVPSAPRPPQTTGWQQIPQTQAWLLHL